MPSRYSKIDLIEYKSTQSRWNFQALFRIILHNEIPEEIQIAYLVNEINLKCNQNFQIQAQPYLQ